MMALPTEQKPGEDVAWVQLMEQMVPPGAYIIQMYYTICFMFVFHLSIHCR